MTTGGANVAALTSPAHRVVEFINHLRANDFAVGPAEVCDAARFLADADLDAAAGRLGLQVMLCGRQEEWERFDELFDAFWHGRRHISIRMQTEGARRARPTIWQGALPEDAPDLAGQSHADADTLDTEAPPSGLKATPQETLARTDLRRFVDPKDIAEAERLAERLARAIVYRLSRRRRSARSGDQLNLRRTIRRNLARGGEPVDLVFRHRPDKPVKIVALLDVSGSMRPYSRFFLFFVRGLLTRWLRADAFLFHTRLLRISGIFRDKDPLRAMGRLSLMAEGFGGGTKIGGSLRLFNERYGAEVIDGRTVVVILSDGYDTDEPALLAAELRRLKLRARRLVWFNPLLGWRDYAPVARGMAAALPYVDCFAAANTLKGLADIEGELARL